MITLNETRHQDGRRASYQPIIRITGQKVKSKPKHRRQRITKDGAETLLVWSIMIAVGLLFWWGFVALVMEIIRAATS